MNEESRRKEGSQSPPANAGEGEQSNILSSLSKGPLSNSARVAILAALLAIRRTTFTELMLAVNVPKSSLNLSLSVLKENKFITVRRGFLAVGGPRTIVEITSEGEKAIMDHLLLMQSLAKRLLPGSDSLPTTDSRIGYRVAFVGHGLMGGLRQARVAWLQWKRVHGVTQKLQGAFSNPP
jgi:DNA-binding transcriptional ArsR family regulator